MGGHGSILPETYWELMLALEHCTPKVVVVDTYMLEKDYHLIDVPCEDLAEADVAAGVEQLHLNMDYWPYSATKKAAVADLISDPDTQRAFLYDFAVYHNRWDELTADDYAWLSGSSGQNKNCLLGAEQRFAVEADPDVTNSEDAAAAIAQDDVTDPGDAAAAIAQNDVTNPGDVAAAIAQDDVTNPEDAAAAIAQNDVTNPGDVAADGTGGAASDTPGGYDAASGLTLAAATPVPTLGRETEGTKYLRKIIETCQDRGIDVVLTFLPMAKYSELDYMSTGSAAAIAAEYDIPFINMLAQDSVVDYYTDMNDNGHLNAGGMQKVTSYIGDWLDINTELEDHRINAISGDNASTTSDNDATSAGKDGAHDYAY
ncbi:MAG: hypothetical protein PHS72_08610 [Lachnospiraceae bacterium]|nr:hypothetical protein [Lachnospiraceae bacterium]